MFSEKFIYAVLVLIDLSKNSSTDDKKGRTIDDLELKYNLNHDSLVYVMDELRRKEMIHFNGERYLSFKPLKEITLYDLIIIFGILSERMSGTLSDIYSGATELELSILRGYDDALTEAMEKYLGGVNIADLVISENESHSPNGMKRIWTDLEQQIERQFKKIRTK